MNENITEYLYKYVENPDPQYAVMLKGKWGCGKSFYISKWLKEYKERVAVDQFVLDPIYVSLYGLKDTSQITNAIDKILHPILHSKGAEFTKKLFKFAGKIAFRTSLDWDKDESEDVTFESTLDSFSLFSTKNESVKTKLIVFDDLERCLIDMKLLLGFINNFVEHGACHVIIVGDETHATGKSKKTLAEFKEKTVGREFEVQPDNLAAIHYFLNDDVPLVDWLKDKEDFINEVFSVSQCDNLRLVRQCLYDYSGLYAEVSDYITDKNESFMLSLLASYLACYCELRGEYKDILSNWNIEYFNGLTGDDTIKNRISELQGKYRPISEKYGFEIFDRYQIHKIIWEIETGFSIKNYVADILRQMSQGSPKQEKLAGFLNLQSEEFIGECNAMSAEIISGNITNMYILGRSLALLAFFDDKRIFWTNQSTIAIAKKHIADIYKAQTDKDELYNIRAGFYQGVSSFGSFNETFVGRDIIDFSNSIFDECESQMLNKLETVLSNLNDTNVNLLSQLSTSPTPDRQCAYNMTSVFKKLDAERVFSSIQHLSNASIIKLCQFISFHFSFGYSLGAGCNRFQDDLDFLQNLQRLVKSECSQRKSVDGYVFSTLSKYIDGAISRASGENDPICVI